MQRETTNMPLTKEVNEDDEPICANCRAWHLLSQGALKGGCSNLDSPFFGLFPAYDKTCAVFYDDFIPLTPFKQSTIEDELFHAYIFNNYSRINKIVQLKKYCFVGILPNTIETKKTLERLETLIQETNMPMHALKKLVNQSKGERK